MTQDEIIEMARQAGFGEPVNHKDWHLPFSAVEAFAKLVADVATAKEREACAKVCDSEAKFGGSNGKKDASASNCAAAIRARGEA